MSNMHADHAHHAHHDTPEITNYQPLIVIISIILLVSMVLQQTSHTFMHAFMGLFFVVFAMFKFIDIKGFADGFATYDLVAARWRDYGYIYPFLELGLGLAYLSSWRPTLTYLITVLLMGVSAAGVRRGMKSGRKLQCACLGTVLKVPLSTVSLIENAGMGLMALWMLL